MFHAHATSAPLPPTLAALSIPERMAEVIRRNRMQGRPTTEDDFLEAVETCDISKADLHLSIGAAKRLVHPEVVRHDLPITSAEPWDFDSDYRRERIALAARMLADAAVTHAPDIFAILRQGDRFTARELGALWPEIIAASAALLAQHQQVRP